MEYHLTMKDMPSDLRPRERLLKEGPQVLSEIELLAILIRSGTSKASALELAAALLSRFGGLKALMQASCEEFIGLSGMGPAKAALLKAALELGRRVACLPAEEKPAIRCPGDVAGLVMEDMRHLDREHFRALLLNTKNHVLGQDRISIGTLNQSSVHPRELFKNAIKRNAAALILIHNHPSGDPTPSKEDLEVTKRLVSAGEIIGIAILDHVIIGDNTYISLKASGLL